MSKKNTTTFALIHKILINNFSKSSLTFSIIYLFLGIVVFTRILDINNIRPYLSAISPDKIIEEYEAQFKSLNKENTQFDVLEKIKLNPIFLKTFYEFIERKCDSRLGINKLFLSSDYAPNYCFDFLYRFGIVELVDTQKSIRVEFIKNSEVKIEPLTTQYLSDLASKESSTLELPKTLSYLRYLHEGLEFFLDTNKYTISSESNKTFGHKKIFFLPLNSSDGYFYLKISNLILKAKLCTQKCPISKIETINLSKEVFVKADFQKNIDKNQDNIINWTLGEHLEEGINISYTDNQYSQFSRLFISLWELLISNVSVFILILAMFLCLFIYSRISLNKDNRNSRKKEIYIDQRHSVMGVGVSEHNTANLQGGSIINESEGAKVITRQSQGYENEDVIYATEQIRKILKELQDNYPMTAIYWKEDLALKAIKQMEKDPNFIEAVVRLIRENKREFLVKKISHPAAEALCDMVAYLYKIKFI